MTTQHVFHSAGQWSCAWALALHRSARAEFHRDYWHSWADSRCDSQQRSVVKKSTLCKTKYSGQYSLEQGPNGLRVYRMSRTPDWTCTLVILFERRLFSIFSWTIWIRHVSLKYWLFIVTIRFSTPGTFLRLVPQGRALMRDRALVRYRAVISFLRKKPRMFKANLLTYEPPLIGTLTALKFYNIRKGTFIGMGTLNSRIVQCAGHVLFAPCRDTPLRILEPASTSSSSLK